MIKSIIKEVIIALLLCLCIILVLGVLLYQYVPTTKAIPNEVAYTPSPEVKQELASGDVDESKIVMTYEVDEYDLDRYELTKNYNPGKKNPFSSYKKEENNGQTTSGGTLSTNNSNTSNNTTQGNNTTTSGGKFFQDKGTK